MKRLLLILVSVWAMTSGNVSATEAKYAFETPAQEALFIKLAAELRCPKCQNQNIADSNAVVAKDLRNKLYELVIDGKNEDEIIDFMKQRYGDFVYYSPPFNAATSILWFGPILFVLVGIGFIIRKTRARNTLQTLRADTNTDKQIAELLKEDKN